MESHQQRTRVILTLVVLSALIVFFCMSFEYNAFTVFRNQSSTSSVKSNSTESEPDIHMVTFSNRLRLEECQSFRTLWMSGMPIHALGIDESYIDTAWWATMKDDPGTTVMKKVKVFAAYDYVQTLQQDALIVFNDASDVVYSPSLDPTELWESIQSVHRLHGTNPRETVIFGGERNCWPFFLNGSPRMKGAAKMCNAYPQSPTTFRFLNAGNWIAFRDPALQMLKQWKYDIEHKANVEDDQHVAALLYVNQTVPIILDFQHDIIGNDAYPLMKSQELVIDYETGMFTNLETDTRPMILHFNGGKIGFLETAQKLYIDWHHSSDYKSQVYSSALRKSAELSGSRLLACFTIFNTTQP